MAPTSLAGVPELPDDVLLSVFKFLPIPDLARCAAVCERWHRVVTGFSLLWKGKDYLSYKSPSESAETSAVLRALPPFQVADIKMYDFHFYISYPYLALSVTDISDLEIVGDRQQLACTSLSTDIRTADVIFSSRSPIGFAALEKLQIVGRTATPEPGGGAERAIGSALELCPNLRELSVRVDSLSADRLDDLEGIGRLQTLEIFSYRLEELAFLRHCSDALEELQLECCCKVPSAAYAALGRLGNLRRLWLRDCRVEAADAEAAAPGLRSLESLQLESCYFVSDLSFTRHCGSLRELRVAENFFAVTGLGRLPAGVRSLYLADSDVAADELSDALARLPQLEELSLSRTRVEHLRFLRHCPRLRHLCLDDAVWPSAAQLLNLLYLERLETLDLMGHSIDVDAFFGLVKRLDGRSPPCDWDVSYLVRHSAVKFLAW